MILTKELTDIQNICHVSISFRMPHGVANEVYLGKRKHNKLVLKYYHQDPHFHLIDQLLNIYQPNHIQSLKVIEKYFIHHRTICIYPFVKGNHILELSDFQIEQILQVVKISFDYPITSYCFEESIFAKYQLYEQYFKKINPKRVDPNIIKQLFQVINDLNLKHMHCGIVHGDLSPYNIIWQKKQTSHYRF